MFFLSESCVCVFFRASGWFKAFNFQADTYPFEHPCDEP